MFERVHDLLFATAAATPEREALVTHDPGAGRWSYRALAERAGALAAQLVGLGVAPGDRVALFAHNGVEWVTGFFAALAAGAVVVPLNTAADPHSLVHYVTDAGARVVIVGPRLERAVIAAGAGLGSITVVAAGANATVLAAQLPGAQVVTAVVEGGGAPTVEVKPGDRAAIIYTSGSTGRPRGAVLRHANLIANVRSIVAYLELGADERALAILPFYYVYGLSILTTTFAVGGAVIVENRFQYPTTALDTVAREQVTGMSGVPSTYAILMNRTDFAARLAGGLPALRWVTQAGGGMNPTLTRALHEALGPRRLFVMYGATEASARLAYLPPAELPEAIGSIGRAIPGVTLTVRDPDGAPSATGTTGELYAEGPNVMEGYWNDPDETARVLGPHGYRTGDLARVDDAGRLWLVGRARDLLKVGGHRVAAREIEDAIVAHPAVHECAVIGVPDELLGDRLRAFVVLRDGAALDAAGLGSFLKDHLPGYKIPSTIDFLDELPKNESGKIMKEALRERA